MSWKDLIDGRYIVAGSPETVRQQMEELIKTLRVGNIFCLMHVGNMPNDKVRHSTRLFAEKVMPHLRNLWPEWKNHDDRFWMHPMHEPVPLRVRRGDPTIARSSRSKSPPGAAHPGRSRPERAATSLFLHGAGGQCRTIR